MCNVNGAEINVYAAASLTDVMKEIGSAYEKESADKILFNLELRACSRDKSSNERRPISLFADEAKMDELAKAGLIATGTRHDLLSNLLVIVVPSDSKLVIALLEELITKSHVVLAI